MVGGGGGNAPPGRKARNRWKRSRSRRYRLASKESMHVLFVNVAGALDQAAFADGVGKIKSLMPPQHLDQ